MGSLQLDCPLCCNETFTCPQSLKYHLLSIVDNILCPSCGTRFQTIFELAEHLDIECGNTNGKSAADSNDVNIVNIKIENEDSADESLNNSILAKALLSPQSNNKNTVFISSNNEHRDSDPVPEENEQTYTQAQEDAEEAMETGGDAQEGGEVESTDPEVYSCLSCGTNFTSIVDHIQEYHEGEEVVVEVHILVLI